jgi:hypothetical protein
MMSSSKSILKSRTDDLYRTEKKTSCENLITSIQVSRISLIDSDNCLQYLYRAPQSQIELRYGLNVSNV